MERMSSPAGLADHLDARINAIIAIWRETVEQVGDVPRAETLSDKELLDHIPEILERLVERLRGRASDAAAEGKKHGRLRWRQGYGIAEIINELGHLRSALIQATFAYIRANEPDLDTLETTLTVINEVLNEAAAEAVSHFHAIGVAEHRAVLAEVEMERAKLRTILDQLPLAVWVVDARGTIITVNPEAQRLQGLLADETAPPLQLGEIEPDYQITRPDGTPIRLDERPLIRALRGEVVAHEEVVCARGDEQRTIAVSATPLTDVTGAIIGAVGVAQEITARKRLEASLAASEARFRAIAEQSPVMIWRTDPAGRYDYVNQRYLDFRGRTLDQELGQGWTEGLHPDDRERYLHAFQAAFTRREPFEQTIRLLDREGRYRWIIARGTPSYDPEGRFLGFLGSGLDITERIELEAALERQRVLAEEASQRKSQLLAALSHDARTPLNAVVLAAQLLESYYKPQGDIDIEECLRTIRNSVGNVLDLLGDHLNLTRLDAGAVPVEVSRFPLGPVLDEALSSIATQARFKGLDVRFEPGDLADVVLVTDRAKLKQILANFLSNALRYTDRGHIRLYGSCRNGRVEIAVEDTGVGIAPEDQERIFDEFATIRSPRRRAGESSGLGLAICRRLATLLQGEIRLTSAPGVGSTFTLILPATVLTSAPFEPEPPEPGPEAPGSGVVVVAEDHPISRQTLARVLRRMGYRVVEAANGQEALDAIRQERPLVVLMDVNMPIMDGVEATLALRADERFRDLPIFALTGDVSPLNQRRIGEAGVNGYLEKPVTWDALRQALASLKPV
jgi:PAS domain S-box-containing protein